MAKLERQSNLELLRILSMFGVLTSHSLTAMYDLHTANFSLPNEIRVYIMNASVLAVNCFVLISGYFQIKQSWRGFVKLLSPCFFYVLFFTGRYNSLPVLSRDMLDRFHERFIFSKATFDS